MPAIVIALLLVAHGLVHALCVSPRPPDKPGAAQWPFDLAHAPALTRLGFGVGALRAIGGALLVVAVAGFGLAALGLLGFVPSLFLPAIVVGAGASIVMLVLFFNHRLALGLVIDAVLLWAVLANGWRPDGVAA